MANSFKSTVVTIAPAELHDRAAVYKAQGWHYVNTSATASKGSDTLELMVTFAKGAVLENLVMQVLTGEHVTSISDLFFAAFVFENETHDLFGINFDGLAIDFKGTFYQLSLNQPMNPNAYQAAAGSAASKTDAQTGKEA